MIEIFGADTIDVTWTPEQLQNLKEKPVKADQETVAKKSTPKGKDQEMYI